MRNAPEPAATASDAPPAVWPARWVTFTAWESGAGGHGVNDDPASFTEMPSAMTLDGISACRATLPPYDGNCLDLTVGHGAPRAGLWAYAFAEWVSETDTDAVVFLRTCGPLLWWVDGRIAFRARHAGEHAYATRLTRGRHILAARVESGENEWRLSGAIVPAGAARPASVTGTRTGLWGPVLAAATPSGATVVVDSGTPAEAALRIDGRRIVSPTGAVHRWHVDGLAPATEYSYAVEFGGESRGGLLRTLPGADSATVCVAGDPQSGSAWTDVARALRRERPDALVIAGDLVVNGLSDEMWTRTFFEPAADLLACVPCLGVPGNHDRRSPVFQRIFADSLGGLNWARRTGAALWVGIDGGLDWSPGGAHARWLEATLAGRGSGFAFVVSHYPPYSSRNHGKLAGDGRVLERASRAAREHLVPLLQRHGVTAVFGGHDHGYERSELPGGLTAIVTGGAGAGLYPRHASDGAQNPFSSVFVSKHHYCRVRVDGNTAVLAAIAPDGEVIDTRTWHTTAR